MNNSIYVLINRDGFTKSMHGKDYPEYVIKIPKRMSLSISLGESTAVPETTKMEFMCFYLDNNLSDFRNKNFVYIER